MTKEEIIKCAESLGLTYGGDNEYGEPEFIGNDDAWEKFNQVDTSEVIEKGDFTGSTNEDR